MKILNNSLQFRKEQLWPPSRSIRPQNTYEWIRVVKNVSPLAFEDRTKKWKI